MRVGIRGNQDRRVCSALLLHPQPQAPSSEAASVGLEGSVVSRDFLGRRDSVGVCPACSGAVVTERERNEHAR